MAGKQRERSEEVSTVDRNPEGEPLRSIINKLSDKQNLRGLHLKHNHMSTPQFKKRTTHLDISGKVHDLFQHVVKKSQFFNSTMPRPDRSRVSGSTAEEAGDLILMDYSSTKIGDRTIGLLIVLDGATSH